MVARSARALFVPVLLAAVPVTAQTALMPSAPVAAMSPAAARAVAAPTQSADGRLQVTAQRATTPPRIDGSLDDDVWQRAPIVGGFTQSEPEDGRPATEATEVQVAYDDRAIYIAAYCRDGEPGKLIVNDIRKDFRTGDQDSFEVILDTFADRRNGYLFVTTPEGAKHDQQVANEGKENNASWDAVWIVKTRTTDDGWIAEIEIPFKTLRFTPGHTSPWGVNFSRRIRRKNEVDFWSPVARAYNVSRVSLAGNLVGIDVTAASRNLRVKPYALGSAIRPVGGSSFDGDPDVGLDVKYGVTPALTLDATVHPDFAQAEADEQQVNLTQFSQFFPEKRDFFLENSGIFYVGDAQRNNRVNPAPTPDEDLLLFFSRRIGLSAAGDPLTIAAGGRLTGKVAGMSVGLLNVQVQGRDPQGTSRGLDANNYTVVRARRNFSSANDVGVLFMQRQSTDTGSDHNRVAGLDWNLRLFGNLDWSSYAMRTFTPGIDEGQYAWRSSVNWEGSFFHGKGGVMQVGEGFQSDLSYYRRTATRKYFTDIGVRPRPVALKQYGIRELHPHIVWNYYENLDGLITGKRLHSGLTVFFNSGAYVEWSENPELQRTTSPLRLASKAPRLPVGRYAWNEHRITGTTDPSRKLSLSGTVTWGGLWSGDQKTVNATLTVKPSYRFRTSVGVQHTDAELAAPVGSFTTDLYTMRTNYSFNTQMFLDALMQYSTDLRQLNANIRFNLIHRPLSDIYVVYNEQRFTDDDAPAAGRGVIVKYTHMLAF